MTSGCHSPPIHESSFSSIGCKASKCITEHTNKQSCWFLNIIGISIILTASSWLQPFWISIGLQFIFQVDIEVPRNRISCPSNRSKQIQETHTAYSAGVSTLAVPHNWKFPFHRHPRSKAWPWQKALVHTLLFNTEFYGR